MTKRCARSSKPVSAFQSVSGLSVLDRGRSAFAGSLAETTRRLKFGLRAGQGRSQQESSGIRRDDHSRLPPQLQQNKTLLDSTNWARVLLNSPTSGTSSRSALQTIERASTARTQHAVPLGDSATTSYHLRGNSSHGSLASRHPKAFLRKAKSSLARPLGQTGRQER